MWKRFLQCSLLLVMIFSFGNRALAQKDQVEGLWLNEEKTAKVQIYLAKDGKYYGKIVWLKEPNKDGKPKVDEKNPKENLRNTPLMGMLILKAFEKEDDGVYDDGTIYDPKNGKTYDCKMTYKGKTLDIRGYVGISLLGRTTVWTRSE